MNIVEKAKAKCAEFDALKTENVGLREKRDKAEALTVELEKVKSSLPASAKTALDEYAKVKPKKK